MLAVGANVCRAGESSSALCAQWCARTILMDSAWCEWGRAKHSADPVQVTLTRRFRPQQFELTQGRWTSRGLRNPSGVLPDGRGDCASSGFCPRTCRVFALGACRQPVTTAVIDRPVRRPGSSADHSPAALTAAPHEQVARTIMQTRGGSWYRWPNLLRVSIKGGVPGSGRSPGLGFRLAETLNRGGRGP
jgi:hypothetical protein